MTKQDSNGSEIAGELVVIKQDGNQIQLKIDPIEALQKPAIVISEITTGALGSVDQWPVVAARLVQGALKGHLLQQFGRELKNLRNQGKINEDYFATNDARSSLNDILEFMDKNVPDEEKLKAIKSIFFSQIALEADEAERQIAHQLLQIALLLKSMDILVLKACYEISQEELNENVTAYGDWSKIIVARLNIKYGELVGLSNEKLENSGLLLERIHGDKSGVKAGSYFRLTELGFALCELMTKY